VALFNMPAAGKCRKGVFRMRKLLLVMLVPVLVLGVIACGGFETDTEVDAYMQGSWSSITTDASIWLPNVGSQAGDIQLFITPNEMTVFYDQFGKIVSTPFNIQFKRASGKDRFLQGIVGTAPDYKPAWACLTDFDVSGVYKPETVMINVRPKEDFIDKFNVKWDKIDFNSSYRIKNFDVTDLFDQAELWFELLEMGDHAVLTEQWATTVDSFIVFGVLTVSDYQTATEIGTVPVVTLVQDDSFGAPRAMAILGIAFADNLPFYMLDVPFRVGMYELKN